MKKLRIFLVGFIALLALGSNTIVSANQKHKLIKIPDYVKLKKDMFTGQYYKVHGKKGKKIINKKGTILKTFGGYSSVGFNHEDSPLTLPLQNYKKQSKIYQDPFMSMKLNYSYLKSYTPKIPIREKMFFKGPEYKEASYVDYKPMFVLTMDNHLQYYDKNTAKKYKYEFSSDIGRIYNKKPTYTAKFNSFKAYKSYYNLYFNHSIKYFKTKKINSNKYRLTIKKIYKNEHTWIHGEDIESVKWVGYRVGDKPFYIINWFEAGD
ncbi:hypothetical protein GSH19_03575 [Lactobacillus sp. S2-2]|uniref:hypothetical protein n=1 Tax=Lactobacillus sp. S2-2 TaxID=2692917 RepID=UPI001F1D488E|nr:hypothetical protein [Lactobacillus sp. S2-2]MCF6515232.1 hypothetical protein [Lactobacillus sp. S2-2]